MRSADADILIVPGLGGSGPEHWQTRWQARLSTARRVEQDEWDAPDPEGWTGRLVEAVGTATRPVVLVAHSLGVILAVRAAPAFPPGLVRGAMLVAMPDVERSDLPASVLPFGPIPRDPLTFPSLLVASRNDPYCTFERAEDLSYAWGSASLDAGEAGHINPDSGFGPWPEGLMRFAGFMKNLSAQ